MKAFGLTPLTAPSRRAQPVGHCSACNRQIVRTDEFVLMYGEAFHRDCAFYRSRDQRASEETGPPPLTYSKSFTWTLIRPDPSSRKTGRMSGPQRARSGYAAPTRTTPTKRGNTWLDRQE